MSEKKQKIIKYQVIGGSYSHYEAEKYKTGINPKNLDDWIEIEKGFCEDNDIDGKRIKYKLDGMSLYNDDEQKSSLLSIPARVEVFSYYASEHDNYREFRLFLPDDFLIYQSNEVPDYLWNQLKNFWKYYLEIRYQDEWLRGCTENRAKK